MITVYSKPNCMQCTFTKNYLADKGVEFKEIDITTDPAAIDHIKSLGFQAVPVVEAPGKEPFFGFRPDQLEALITK